MTQGTHCLIRTGGGKHVGFGHVRRCLSLAGALRELKVTSVFLVDGDAEVKGHIAQAGFEVVSVRPDEDLAQVLAESRVRCARAIVVDSYALNTGYFHALAAAGALSVAIDDLADRHSPVTVIVNGTPGAERLAYRALPDTLCLLGPRYMLLRPEFAEQPHRDFPERVCRVLITVGGSDSHDLTPRLIRWSAATVGGAALDVIIGPSFDNLDRIEAAARSHADRVTLHRDPSDMRALMLAADLAVCGGGQTTFEMAATGTPAVAIRVADNQMANLQGLAAGGVLVWVGNATDADLEDKLTHALATLADDPVHRRALSRCGRALADGQGSMRVARALCEMVEGRPS